jgi:hypothetical protein
MALTVWDLNPSRGKRFFSSQNSQDWFWEPLSLYSVGTGVLYQGIKLPSLDAEHSIHHLMLRVRMSGGMSVLPYVPS